MTRILRSHPRYASLRVRAELAARFREGIVVPEGLIAHGRAEAFDYLLGERTSPSARRAVEAAAHWLANARHPVLSVNGNVAALAAREVAELARRLPGLAVEVNLFHRTPSRARAVAELLRRQGVAQVLGERPTVRVPGLPSDRGSVDARGIARADVVVVPLEDGDRAAALRGWGRRTIAIDLNPLSRTSLNADLPIVDELTRALRRLARELPAAIRNRRPGVFPRFDRARALADARATISRRLTRGASPGLRPTKPRPGRVSRRPARGSARRSGRRP